MGLVATIFLPSSSDKRSVLKPGRPTVSQMAVREFSSPTTVSDFGTVGARVEEVL
jgi:hypothetical protein